jgi:membrane-associated phospholipid phosphatase
LLSVIKQKKIYFIALAVYFILGALVLLFTEKGQTELFLNQHHHPALDFVFKYITYLGDGLIGIPFILLMPLFYNAFQGVVLLSAAGLTFVVVHFLKWVVFQGSPRPSLFFAEGPLLHYVEGVNVHLYNSFPSGHTAQAFCLFMVLALFSKNNFQALLFLLGAIAVAVSRMYLMQHFFVDTYFGALIATIITFFTYTYFVNHTRLSQNEKWQKGWLYK